MGLKDKIPVITLPIPSASPALLHATHLLLLLLTILFLILPSFSGPSTGYWWISITLPIPGSTTGSVWNLGGFGGCKVGDTCGSRGGENLPVMAGQVMSTLMYHFAGKSPLPLSPLFPLGISISFKYSQRSGLTVIVGGMFLVMALAEYGLIYKPGPRPICAGWTATYLLIAAPVVVSTTMIVDLIVRSKMLKNDSIGSIKTGIVFWL